MTQGGAAQPVVTSTEAPDGGPARPVAIVSAPFWGAAGPPLKVVQVVDNRARIGGAAQPVYVVSGAQASSPQAGAPIPVYVTVGGSFYTQKVLTIAPANLLAYWPLAEASGTVIVDESGNGRNGVYKAAGEPLLGQTGIGDGRTSALFDGTNDYANIFSASLAAAFNGAEGTLALWMRVSGAGVWTDATSRRLASLRVDTNNRVLLDRSTNNNQLAWSYIAGAVTKSANVTTGAPTTWQHLALTWSKSADQTIFYLNGAQSGATLIGLGTWAGSLASTVTVLGASDTTGANPWSGYEAHAAIWSTPLSAAQIAALAVVP